MTKSVTMTKRKSERPAVGVGAVIWKNDSILFIKRGKPPMKGGWSLPGGHQERGETVRQAVLREVQEETGLTVDIIRLIDVVDAIIPDADGAIEHHFTLIDFYCEWISGDPLAGDDAADVRWVPRDELTELNLWNETNRIILMSEDLRGSFGK